MLGAPVHGVAHFGAEAAAQRRRLAGDILPVEPGGAGHGHLPLDVEVGAHRDRHAALAARVVDFPKLHDRAWRAVAGRVEMGQLDMGGAAVDPVGKKGPPLLFETLAFAREAF